MSRRAGVEWLLVAIILAGCAADPAPASAEAGTPTGSAPPAAASADTVSITGTVVNEELAPVAGARVGSPALKSPTQVADAQGAFTFNDVPPGTYALYAEQLGYVSKAQKVTVAAGEVATVRFVLTAMAPAGVARQVHYQADGFIELAVVVPQVGVVYSNASGLTLNFILYKVAPDAASAVMGLKWENAAPLTGRYSRINTFLCKPESSCTQQNFTRGFSPIVIRTDNLLEAVGGKSGYFVAGQFYPTTCQATSNELCASNPDTITAVAFQQRYKFYTSVFYVEPAPLDFSPVPA